MTLGEQPRRLAGAVLAIALCSYAVVLLADTTLHKQFWLDEGFEIVHSCDRSLPAMLVRGAAGCSPAPLFSMAERLVVRAVEPLGLTMRLTYRAVSLAAAALTLLVLLLGVQRGLGVAAALVAFATLASDPVFHHYAEQNRAYSLWVATTAVLLFAAASASALPEPRLRTRLAWLLLAAAPVCLTATPGCVQVTAAFAAFWWFNRRAGTPLDRRAVLVLAGGAVALTALDLHYWASSEKCGWGTAADLGLDVLAGGDRWVLARRAIAPLWPPAMGVWDWIARAVVLVGVLVPARWWMRRDFGGHQRFALALWLASLAQALVALPVAASLTISHYHFLPRMFIFGLVPRATFGALGFWILARAAGRLAGERNAMLVRGASWVAGAAVAGAALVQADRIGRPWHFPFPPVGEVACAALNGPELRLLQGPDAPDEFRLNFLVRLGRAFEACASAPRADAPPRDLLALDATNQPDWLRVVDAAPPGFEPLTICGETVTLRNGRMRGP